MPHVPRAPSATASRGAAPGGSQRPPDDVELAEAARWPATDEARALIETDYDGDMGTSRDIGQQLGGMPARRVKAIAIELGLHDERYAVLLREGSKPHWHAPVRSLDDALTLVEQQRASGEDLDHHILAIEREALLSLRDGAPEERLHPLTPPTPAPPVPPAPPAPRPRWERRHDVALAAASRGVTGIVTNDVMNDHRVDEAAEEAEEAMMAQETAALTCERCGARFSAWRVYKGRPSVTRICHDCFRSSVRNYRGGGAHGNGHAIAPVMPVTPTALAGAMGTAIIAPAGVVPFGVVPASAHPDVEEDGDEQDDEDTESIGSAGRQEDPEAGAPDPITQVPAAEAPESGGSGVGASGEIASVQVVAVVSPPLVTPPVDPVIAMLHTLVDRLPATRAWTAEERDRWVVAFEGLVDYAVEVTTP